MPFALGAAAKWVIPLIIGLLGEKLRSSSEGMGGQAVGALMELAGLATVGGKLGGVASKGLKKAMGLGAARGSRAGIPKTKIPKWAKETALGTGTTVASFAPFMLPMAMAAAEQPDWEGMGLGGAEGIDPELMNALTQLMQAGPEMGGQQQMMPMGPAASGLIS